MEIFKILTSWQLPVTTGKTEVRWYMFAEDQLSCLQVFFFYLAVFDKLGTAVVLGGVLAVLGL